ncbi:winged helix-turn-helix domain-containing protein [Wenzhouxiangella marina]|uniref:Uncharacterized protein n=1 Tax=Wenzhouxiangella marina TaxID=1579979 RepID=A0A0K0XUB5_9GAMM|nr:winged helix-turn-helix domain-containing protein [Wenzhouxiangella marina]AKS41212.1 hypothetical protein WM2015_831 [Wenzhouxiangella marina]MBB6088092.1 DNA-binding winged helix-turn-helix (wHTH) protein/tetratricopeptide (TPR) repeat protein [Wenzhouxiangella marina]
MSIHFQDFELDLAQKLVLGPDGPIQLRPQTFAVLCHLIEQAPAVVSRDELLDAVWGHQATSVSSVPQTIKELRQALGDSSSDPRIIATRRGLGYQFIATVESSNSENASTPPHPPPGPTGTGKRAPWALLGLLGLLIAAFVVWRLQPLPPSPPAMPPTLAISAMVNSADDPELNWLAPAFETYLGHALVELGGFRVLARDQETVDAPEPADVLVEGRYLDVDGQGPRLLAQLRRQDSGEIIGNIETGLGRWDVARMSIDMANEIRRRLGLPATADDGSVLRARLPADTEGQRAYFAAGQALERFDRAGALDALNVALNGPADGPQLRRLQAQVLAESGDIEAARSIIEQALESTRLWPARERLDIEAAAALLDFDYERATDRLQAITQFYPDPANSRRLVNALIQSGRLEAGRQALSSLRAARPDDARLALLAVELARLERDQSARLDAARDARRLAEAEQTPGLIAAARLAEAGALTRSGQLDDARAVLESLLDEFSDLAAEDEAEARLGLATIEFQQGRLESALNMIPELKARYQALNHPEGLAEAYMLEASVLDRSGRSDASIAAMEAAMEQLETLGDPRQLARAGVLYGVTLMRARQTEAAETRLEEAASYFRRVRDRQGEGAALINRATLLARAGRANDAEPVFERALEAFLDAGDLRGQAIVLGNLAAVAYQRRDVSRSIELSEEALGLFEVLNAQTDIARVSYNLGLTQRSQGRLLEAERRIRQAAEAFSSQGAAQMQMRTLTTLANLMVDMGRPNALGAVIEQTQELSVEDPDERSVVDIALGRQALMDGELAEARAHFQRALELADAADSQLGRLLARFQLARVALAEGSAVTAEQEALALRSEYAETRDSSRQLDVLLLLAEALIEQDRSEAGARELEEADRLLADAPDARQALELAILRSRISPPDLARERLQWVIETAGAQGYLPLLERARRWLALLEE